MKKWIFGLTLMVIFALTHPATAITCQVQESDGVPVSASTLKAARDGAWNACIDKKMSQRVASRGDVDVDGALTDAEPCLNAKMKCQ